MNTPSDHPNNNNNNGYTFVSGRGYRTRQREDIPSKNKREMVSNGRQEQDKRRREDKGSYNGGKQKVTTPTDSSITIPGNHSDGPLSNENTSRYNYRDVPPRFQLYSNKHSSSNKHFSNSKSPNSKTNHYSQGNNKKTKGTSSHWGSSHVGHTDNAWCHTPETDTPTSSIGRNVKHQGHHNNPWGNVPQDSNWTSEDELANSDHLAEEVLNTSDTDRFTIDKRDGGSDFEELEIEGLPTPSDNPFGQHPGGRLRNDSDAMKDGISSNTHVQEEPLEGSLWRGHISRSSMGSSSSVNSAGSNSSWKGVNNGSSRSSNNNNGNNYQRSASPRKHGRYENHRSLSTSGKTMMKYPPRPKPKQVLDLDDGVDLLQCEPSGWGDLPSPKPSDVDTGTDVWGIPDDIKKKMKKDPKQGNGWIENSHVDEWGDQNYSNKMAGNNLPGNGPNQWSGSESSWNNNVERSPGFSDNVKLLVDMGFTINESEYSLKRNNNSFEAALGDLLALVTVKEDEYPPDLSPSNFPLPGPGTRGLQHGRNTNNRLSPSHSRGPSPRTVSPSAIHVTNDQLHSTLGSTPAAPTIPVTTQNHLLQIYQQQQQQPPQIIGNQQQYSRSQSNQHTDLSNVNTQYVHKVLTQQLRDHHLLKQSLVNQMKNPQSPKHQQILTIRLNQVNTSILLVNQHLVMTSQLAYQQQQKGNSDGNSADEIGSNEHVPISKTLSPPEVFGMDGHNSSDINSLGYSMQNMSMHQSNSATINNNTSVDQQPVRTISKLQRIISSSSHDTKPIDSFANISDEHSVFEEEHQGINMPIPNPIGLPNPGYSTVTNSSSTISDYHINSNVQSPYFTNTSQHQLTQPPLSSSPLTSSGKFSRSVDEIPEFKPGVPWNPSLSSVNSPNPSFNNTRKVRSDSHRPDSIQLSTSGNGPYSNNDRPNFLEPKSENEFYRDPKSSYGNPHVPYHRPGSSPGIAPGNPRYGGNGNYSSTPTGGYNPGGYYNRPPTVHGFPPTRPSPSTPSQMFPPNQFNGGRNRQRLYSQQSGPAGYNDLGQRNRGYDVGRKWSFDGNPWGVPEKSGSSIWSIDSTENLLSPVGSEMAFSPAPEWKAPIRKPSLPVSLSSPTNCIFLKNVPPQIDENSIREVCSEYGHVNACTYNTFNSTALIYYRSKEEALQAKMGLEKNPIICGINVQPSFATEKVMATFSDQRTPSHHSYGYMSAARMEPSPQWLSSDSIHSPSTQQRVPSVGNRSPYNQPPMTPSRQDHHLVKKDSTSTVWNRDFSAPGGPTMSGSSSLWSNGGLLPGITSPWSSQSNADNIEGGFSEDHTGIIGTSPSMSPFLPNGLFNQ